MRDLLREIWTNIAPLLRSIARMIGVLSAVGVLVSLASLLLRDRVEAIYMIVYVPTLLIGVGTLLFWCLVGRRVFASRRWVGGMLVTSMVVTLWSLLPMIGLRPTQTIPPGYTPVRVIQWNIMSGGQFGNRRLPFLGNPTRLKQHLQARPCDVLVLSEAPFGPLVEEIRALLGDGWSMQHKSGFPDRQGKNDFEYFARSMVMSKYPVLLVMSREIPHGLLCGFEVDLPDRVLRILVVDGDSWPYHKTPYLHAVADEMRAAMDAGRGYDIVCGDFNAISRSVGFDAINGTGYVDASGFGGQWRGTFPVVFPILDIDHVYVAPRHRVARFDAFSTMASDHRGHDFTLGIAPRTP